MKEKIDTPISPVKVVVVTDVAYRTYLAVLYWIYSRNIAFAPLLSSFRTAGKSRIDTLPLRSAALTSAAITTSSTSPVPVSPKSVFRLSHYLGLTDLAQLALDSLKSQLKPDTAAYELYSEVASLHPEIRDIILEFVVENWDSVEKAKATEEMEQKAENGELEAGAAASAIRLAKRLAKRTVKA